jgi:hypothetical protein
MLFKLYKKILKEVTYFSNNKIYYRTSFQDPYEVALKQLDRTSSRVRHVYITGCRKLRSRKFK